MSGSAHPRRETREGRLYRTMIAVTDQVAEAALGGADAGELTRVLATTTARTVVLLDPKLALRTAANPNPDEPVHWDGGDTMMTRLLKAVSAERRPLRIPSLALDGVGRGRIATPITIGGTVLGYLVLLDEPSDERSEDLDLLIAGYAATLFALTLAHERTTTDLGLRYQGAVIDALVSGHFLDAADARRKALSIGLPSNVPFRVGVLRAGDTDHGTLDDVVTRFVASSPMVIAACRGTDVVSIVPEADARPDRESGTTTTIMAELAARVRAANAPQQRLVTVGVSERTAGPDRAPRAFAQAEQAIDLGIRLGRDGEVVAYDELGIYRLLLQIGDMQQLSEFAEDVLGPLIEYDATHKVGLVRTLSVYLSQHASLKQAARVLKVHANTISYRMQRIQALTPLDLDDPDDRLLAHVAVKIVETRNA